MSALATVGSVFWWFETNLFAGFNSDIHSESVMWPPLFLLYINDFTTVIKLPHLIFAF